MPLINVEGISDLGLHAKFRELISIGLEVMMGQTYAVNLDLRTPYVVEISELAYLISGFGQLPVTFLNLQRCQIKAG